MALQAGSIASDTTPPDDQGVTIYERIDFGGDSRVLVADVSDLSDLQGPCGIGDGNWSDCMSAIQLSSGWTATLYELDGFEGDSLNVTSSISNLENFPGCEAEWNKCAKSIRVRRPLIDHDSAGYSEMHPLDIPDEAGFYVYSEDGLKALRLFGSFRMLAVLDNKQNFHAFDLVPPKIPTGDEDFRNINSIWTVKMSRVGIDALVRGRTEQKRFRSTWLIRFEADWKGDTESFRIRHFFVRSKHLLVGQSWSTMNNLAFLPLAVDGRLTGAGLGMRTPQIRYYTSRQNWNYQVSLEYRKTTMIKPASLSAISQVGIPDLVGRVGHKSGRSEVAIAAILRPNRVQFPDEENRVQRLLGYGGVLGINYQLSDRNRLKFSISGGTGMGAYMADYAWTDIDVAYNPSSMDFENVGVYGGFLALEHDWTKNLSSTIGGSYLGAEEKDFFQDLQYIGGYKTLVNLFYKPVLFNNQFILGGEVEYGERTNMDDTQNNTTRMSALLIYNF
jgi:hypothetical protein